MDVVSTESDDTAAGGLCDSDLDILELAAQDTLRRQRIALRGPRQPRPAPPAAAAEVRRVQNPADVKRAGGEAAVVGLQGRTFMSLKVKNLAHAGLSLKCENCGYSKNVYHVRSGAFDDDEAQRRLLQWESSCPGSADDHKRCGGALLCWYAG